MFFIFTSNFLCTIDVLLIALMEEYSLQYKVDITKRLLCWYYKKITIAKIYGFKYILDDPKSCSVTCSVLCNGKGLTSKNKHWLMKKNSSIVIYKSFENILSNSFQVIIFERISKNCFKVNILSKIFWNLCFSIKKMI